MISHIERLFINSHTDRKSGWLKTTVAVPENKNYRNIRIGNTINCNGELFKDNTTMTKIEDTLLMYDVKSSKLEIIESNFEHSVSLYLIEEEYMKLINGINERYKITENINNVNTISGCWI